MLVSDKATKTILPAPAGTYAIMDGRDEAETDARIPLHIYLVPVIAWSIDPDDEIGVDAVPISIRGQPVIEDDEPVAYLMPDGKVMAIRGSDADSIEQFVKAAQEWEASRPVPETLRVVGGAR